MAFRLLLVNVVETLRLDLTVDEGTGKASTVKRSDHRSIGALTGYSQELLGLLVGRGLAVLLAVLLVGLGSLVGRSGGDELVRERRLVGRVGNLQTKVRRVGRGQTLPLTCW